MALGGRAAYSALGKKWGKFCIRTVGLSEQTATTRLRLGYRTKYTETWEQYSGEKYTTSID